MRKPLKYHDRMLDVAAMLALGHSKAAIARQLGCHRKQLYRLLESPEMQQLISSMSAAVEGLRLEVGGVLLYRSSALLAEKLKQELEDLKGGKQNKGTTLSSVFRVHRECAASHREALALRMLAGDRRQPVPVSKPKTEEEQAEPWDFEKWKAKALEGKETP